MKILNRRKFINKCNLSLEMITIFWSPIDLFLLFWENSKFIRRRNQINMIDALSNVERMKTNVNCQLLSEWVSQPLLDHQYSQCMTVWHLKNRWSVRLTTVLVSKSSVLINTIYSELAFRQKNEFRVLMISLSNRFEKNVSSLLTLKCEHSSSVSESVLCHFLMHLSARSVSVWNLVRKVER